MTYLENDKTEEGLVINVIIDYSFKSYISFSIIFKKELLEELNFDLDKCKKEALKSFSKIGNKDRKKIMTHIALSINDYKNYIYGKK